MTLHVRDNLAWLRHSMGRRVEAVALYREVLAASRRTRGADHGATLDTQSALAVVLAGLGDHEEAASLARDAVERSLRRWGDRDVRTGGALSSLAEVLVLSGDRAGAAELLLDVLEIYESTLGREHPDFWNVLAEQRALTGDLEGSISALRAAVERGLSDPRDLADQPELQALLDLPAMQQLLAELRVRADATRTARSSAGIDGAARPRASSPTETGDRETRETP